jgi:hypothetical protein
MTIGGSFSFENLVGGGGQLGSPRTFATFVQHASHKSVSRFFLQLAGVLCLEIFC